MRSVACYVNFVVFSFQFLEYFGILYAMFSSYFVLGAANQFCQFANFSNIFVFASIESNA